MKPIRVLIVDDSITARETLIGIIESDSEISVVGEAKNGKEAIELTRRLKPDIITMDIRMPIMDGLEAIQYIMAYYPTPIVVIAASAFSQGNSFIFKSLEYGALEVLEKPCPGDWKDLPNLGSKIIKDLKTLAKIPVVTHIKGKNIRKKTDENGNEPDEKDLVKVVSVASSTGGPKALMELLSGLPENFSGAVLVVQHISDGFMDGLADWLNKKCRLTVKIADNNERITPGAVFLAPTGKHMKVKENDRIALTDEPPVCGLKPAADLLFKSAAQHYGRDVIGVILTGMGKDGSEGLKAIKKAGGRLIAQDEESSLVYGMPKAAVETGCVDEVLSIDRIALRLKELVE